MRKQPVSKKNVILITLICLLFVVCAIAGDLLMKAKAASAGDLSFTFSLLMPEKAQEGTLKPWKRLYAIPDHLRIRSRKTAAAGVQEASGVRAEDIPLLNGKSADVLSDLPETLSEQEIAGFMELLDTDTEQQRRDLVSFALSSVGRIPYYWGGKAEGPRYQANRFGEEISPDRLGRSKAGLDCSGWISWVYLSVTGKRTPGETTATLVNSGAEIEKEDLQPGDVVIRTGEKAHAVMFLAWADDDRMIYVHETGGSINNVKVSVDDIDYPYCRSYLS